jgi:hypothetical protein
MITKEKKNCYDTRETPNYLLSLLGHGGKSKLSSAVARI